MTPRKASAVLGKWRIVETDRWGSDYLDMQEPAYIRFDENGRGKLVFGLVEASLECAPAVTTIFFSFEGSDELTPISGSGSAELTDDGTLDGEIRFHHGEEAQFTARRW